MGLFWHLPCHQTKSDEAAVKIRNKCSLNKNFTLNEKENIP